MTDLGATGVGMSIVWQQGAMENGVNGAMPEMPLRAVVARLEYFQRMGPMSEYNQIAIDRINDAIAALNARIADRHDRGVIGTNQP